MEVKITELMGALDPPPEGAYPAPDTGRLREAVLRKLGSPAAPQAMRRRGVRRTLLIAAAVAAALSVTALAAAGGFGWLSGEIQPDFIDAVEPVEELVSAGGIEVELIAAQRYGERAVLYVSLADVSGLGRVRDGAEIRAAKLSGGSGRISHSIKSAPALYDAASGRLLYEFHVSTSEEQWRDGLTLTIADILYNERELDVRCDGLDLASAAEEDGIHAEIPGLEGAYVEFVRLTGGALKVGISRDMAAGEEYSFRPYLLSADGSRHEAASGVRGITPLDPLRRPRGWDEGETSATLVYTIPAPGAEELGGCTLCLRVVCRDALRGTWEIPVELSEGEEPIELRADIRDGDKLYEDVRISLTPLCLRIECLDEAFIGYDPSDIPALTASLEGADGPIQASEPGMDWTAPIQPVDYNDPDGGFTAIWYARSAIDTASVTAIVIGDTRIEI